SELLTRLKQKEVSLKEELEQALESDEPPESPNSYGPKVSAWVAKMLGKAADGSWKIGIGGAGSLLAMALGKYFGFG
ncbi:MAG: hypothetical protein H8E32_00160, partial [Nitrospinae bacterium]|nr:hypothetical protein [Nitrospinota bacterium]